MVIDILDVLDLLDEDSFNPLIAVERDDIKRLVIIKSLKYVPGLTLAGLQKCNLTIVGFEIGWLSPGVISNRAPFGANKGLVFPGKSRILHQF